MKTATKYVKLCEKNTCKNLQREYYIVYKYRFKGVQL